MNTAIISGASRQRRDLVVTTTMLRARLGATDLPGEASEFRELLAEDPSLAMRRLCHADSVCVSLAVRDQERSLRAHAEESENEMRRERSVSHNAIREAHHRVKNTLQIAASVLSLHARAAASEQVRSALRDSYGRLQLLAKVHELLYSCGSGTGTESVLMPSLLGALGDALRQSFAEVSARVRLHLTVESLTLPVDEAIALALLTNEVVTNAYKHAFPNEACGEIAVALARTSDDALTLQVTDDGAGMCASTSGGIGLQLVRTFAAQLGGVLSIAAGADGAGTMITVTRRPGSRLGRQRTDPSCVDDAPAPAASEPR